MVESTIFSFPVRSGWNLEVGTTVAVGILLVISLAVALVFYWRYREEESHYLQVRGESHYLQVRESPTSYR